MQRFCALESTLPDTLTLPWNEATREPPSLQTRFLAALASLSLWIYCSLLFVNIVGIIMLLMLVLGFLPRITRGDADGIRVLTGLLLGGPYVFLYLPLRWNGLTYGQRLMGIWIAPKDARETPIGFCAVVLRFLGTGCRSEKAHKTKTLDHEKPGAAEPQPKYKN